MQGIRAVYAPFQPLVKQASEGEAFKVDALFAAAYSALSPFFEFKQGEEYPDATPYSYITVKQRAPIQAAFYNLAYGIFEVRTSAGLNLATPTPRLSLHLAALPSCPNPLSMQDYPMSA